MTLVAPASTEPAALELDLLIRQARQRQRRRRRSIAAVLALAAAAYLGVGAATSTGLSRSLLARPLRFPMLGPGNRCPVTAGRPTNNPYFAGGMFGRGPVRVSIGNVGNLARGQLELGTTSTPRWHALETIWFAEPGYNGPFLVRAARLGKPGPIEVQPGSTGQSPGSGPLFVPAGPTINSFPEPGPGVYHGYRTVPGSTWVKSPGCYAWQVDGRGFSNVIVVRLLAPAS